MNLSKSKGHLAAFVAKMESAGLSPLVIDTFCGYYQKVLQGETGLIYDRDIRPVAPDEIEDVRNLTHYAAAGKKASRKAVRIVLNGGLGTSMGLTGPKSLLTVKDDQSFLKLIIGQAQDSHVRLAVMNSFNTHADTLTALTALSPSHPPRLFLQHKFPKILQENLAPAVWPGEPTLEWNPPGHGDVYAALAVSGTLQAFLDEGICYAFISNSDNLGARVDQTLLGYFAENRFAFMMEVAEKTPADTKGGHLARHKSGRLILRESAQCPREELEAFQNIRRYRYFNTNSIWINLEVLKRQFDKYGTLALPMILNPKTLDPRDATSPGVLQVETAMGAAISLFENAVAVKVPRSRFFPVKTCNDLLAVRSDCFVVNQHNNLTVNPARRSDQFPQAVKVKLDPRYYGRIDDLEKRFSRGIPSLVGCESLRIEGDVFFEQNVVIRGSVLIKNSGRNPQVIKAGTVVDHDLAL